MKIYDCFTFFNENLMLELRLNTLDKFVDYFVIVECGQTHQGTFKGKQIDHSILAKFKDKIRYIYLEDFNDVDIASFEEWLQAWKRENYQREQLAKGLYDAKPDDIVIVSDLDEVPDLSKINFKDVKEDVLAFKMSWYYYKFNLKHTESWFGSKLCSYKNLKGPQWLKSLKLHKRYPWWRLDKFFAKNYVRSFKIVNNGWHFTYVMNTENIIKKLESYAHIEHNNEQNKNPAYIESCISKGIDIIYPQHRLEKVEESLLPQFIIENREKFAEFIA
ncbi:MAG: hypothetical protein P8L77_03090 [Gammaproteobacteria bacterium]|nr:hypothetical protein [Gammaproteobacteria bacterium]